MKIDDIIYILIFILPGIIAEKISYYFDIPDDKKRSEFGDIVNGILLSMPIVLITFLIVFCITGFTTIQQYINKFNDIKYLFLFVILILSISIVTGIFKGFISKPITDLINKVRKKIGKIKIDNETCWRKAFLDDTDSHYLEIMINGNEYKGFTKHYSLPNESKSMVLYIPEELDDYPEYTDKIKKVRQTYIDLEKNIVIKDYDIKEYKIFIDSLINKK